MKPAMFFLREGLANGSIKTAIPTMWRPPAAVGRRKRQRPPGWSDPVVRLSIIHEGDRLREVPPPCRTPDVCRVAVASSGLSLNLVPESLRTTELCLIAVRHDARSMPSVPDALWTRELRLFARKKFGPGLERVADIIPRLQGRRIARLLMVLRDFQDASAEG